MSESYTVGGDSYSYIYWDSRPAQTFTPLETHVLQWVDLNIYLTHLESTIGVHIYETDANHHPIGNFISRSTGMIYPWRYAFIVKRTRFAMTPQTLYQGKEYVMVISTFPPFPYIGHSCVYDAFNATYPRGMRLITTDGGATWHDRPNDDLVFAEFGTPPSPPSPPEPPIEKFAVFAIQFMHTATGVSIRVTTNVPSHMFCYWTTHEPDKHKRPRLRRGVQFSDILAYCFVAWHEREQEEEGDTLYHTFILEPWEYCETRWLVFRAEIAGVMSESISPIFTYNRPVPMLRSISATGHNRTVYMTHAAWQPCHDASDGIIAPLGAYPWDKIGAGTALTASFWIYRGYLSFDTSVIPAGARIRRIVLSLWIYAASCNFLGFPHLYVTKGVQNTPIVPANYGDQLPHILTGGQRDIRDLVIGQYNDFDLTHIAKEWINRLGITKLCLRGEFDIIDKDAIWRYSNQISFYPAQKGAGYHPLLIIYYDEPTEPALPWLWYEPWGDTLNENNYWIAQPVITPPTITLANSLITLENTGETAQWISTLISTTYPPITLPDGRSMHFYYDSPLSEGDPVTHFHAYVFRFQKNHDFFYLEAVISNGTLWPPWNGSYAATPLGGAFFVGVGKGNFDLTRHFMDCRTFLGLDPDPEGWKLTHFQLRIEDFNATPGGKLTNDYCGFSYTGPSTYHIASDDDECRVWWSGLNWHYDFAHHETITGYLQANIYKAGYAMIFRNVDIPQGAWIEEANITFSAFGLSENDDCNTYLKGQKEVDAAPFFSYADYISRPRTTALVDWSNIGHWQDGYWYKSPSIKDIIQEIVNLPDWEPGKDICLFWEDHDDRSTHVDFTTRMAETHHHDPLRSPYLTVSHK